jgi:hypothetical protein
VSVATEDLVGAHLHAVCLFIGYPRSGHSVVGSLLDAHPDVVISHQVDAMKLVFDGQGRDDLIRTILADSAHRAAGGRGHGRYSYAVSGQWQGRARVLRVIGDCRGGKTSRRLAKDPDAAERFAEIMHLPLRFVHVVRNPYDNIATLASQAEHTLESAIAEYERLAAAVGGFLGRTDHPALTICHEALVDEPHRQLGHLCGFLSVEADDAYVEACARILFPSPRRTREAIEWPRSAVAAVDDVIARHPFLEGYTFKT